MAVAKTMPRYTTGSGRQVQWAAAASPTIPAGRAGGADHRKATDNRGERRSADRAGQHPVPSVRPSRPITWPRRSGRRRPGSRWAATSVRNDRGTPLETVEDNGRRCCHQRPLTWHFSPVFPGRNTMQFLPRRHGADLARRKPGVQIPSPPPPTSQVRASPASSRRRSLHAAAAPRPHAQVAVQLRRLAAARRLGPGPHTMTTQRSRRLAAHPGSPPTGDPRAHPANPGRPRGRPSHCPTTSHDDGQVQSDPSADPADLRQPRPPGSDPEADELAVDRAGDHADAGHPSHAAACPPPPSTTSRPDTGDAGTHGHRTPTLETRHRTSGRSDARTGHRTAARGQASVMLDTHTRH